MKFRLNRLVLGAVSLFVAGSVTSFAGPKWEVNENAYIKLNILGTNRKNVI